MSFKRSCPYSKSIDGLQEGNFTSIEVNGDADIEGNLSVEGNGFVQGNLTVIGNINSGGGGGSTTMDYFEATDASNQFRAQSSTIDFKSSTNAAPTFRFKNNINETFPTKIEVGEINLTDGSNQILALNALLDIKVDSATPVVRFKDNADTTETSELQAGKASFVQHTNSNAITYQKNNRNDPNASASLRAETHGSKWVELSAHAATHGTFPNEATIRTSNLAGLDLITDSASAPISLRVNSADKLVVNDTNVSVTTSDLVFTNNALIRRNTADGADTGALVITAGGADSAANRGAKVFMFGNESGAPGLMGVVAGNVPAGRIAFYTGDQLERGSVNNDGQFQWKVDTQAVSTTTGSIVTPGGIGIAKNCIVGGNLQVGGTLTAGSITYASTSSGTFAVTNASGTTFTVASITDATSPTTGAAIYEGGIAVKKNIIAGGNIELQNTGLAPWLKINNTGSLVDRFSLQTFNAGGGNFAIFLNGPTRTSDGGANSGTIRNEAGGEVRVVARISGTDYGLNIADSTSHVVRSTNYLNAGLFVSDLKAAGTGSSTIANFNRDGMNNGEEVILTVGKGLTGGSGQIGYRHDAVEANREVTLGLYGGAAYIKVKPNVGLQINNGAFFGHTTGTFSGQIYVPGGGAYQDYYQEGFYVKTGRQCTIHFKSKRGVLPSVNDDIFYIDLPFAFTYDADFVISRKSTEVGNYKPIVRAAMDYANGTQRMRFVIESFFTWVSITASGGGDTLEVEGTFTYITAS